MMAWAPVIFAIACLPSSRRRHRRLRIEARAAVAIPILLDAVAARRVAVHRRHESEQAPVRAISKQMAPHADRVARLHVLALDTDLRQARRTCRLERPCGDLPLVVLD